MKHISDDEVHGQCFRVSFIESLLNFSCKFTNRRETCIFRYLVFSIWSPAALYRRYFSHTHMRKNISSRMRTSTNPSLIRPFWSPRICWSLTLSYFLPHRFQNTPLLLKKIDSWRDQNVLISWYHSDHFLITFIILCFINCW